MANFFDQFDSAPTPASGVGVDPRFADAITSIESGGNYRSVGPATRSGDRALGRYQIMTSNIRPWSQEILGREVSPQEFITDPKIQDAIFNGKFGSYVNKYGPDGAARAWFAGENGMNDPNRRDVNGTTVADYGRRFADRAGISTDISARKRDNANYFDQFDEASPQPQSGPSDIPRVVINTGKKPLDNDAGALDAAARGAAQGLTLNFGDELRGLVEASGANPNDPASLSALLTGAMKYWSGDQDAKKRYDEAVARERAANQVAEENHPVASTVGQIGGSLVLPVGAASRAATLPARMAVGSGVGAALGGIAGAGEGQGGVDTVSRTLTGAALGGALGGAAPAVVEGAVRAGRAIASPVVNAIRGVRDPDSEAARRVVTAIGRDQAIDPQATQRLTPQEFAASVQNGGPAAIMDIGGETTRALARSAANTSPEGRAVMNRAINDRFEGQTERVNSWLRNTFNFPDARSQSEALTQAARNVNRPRYAQAYRDGAGGLWDDGLDQISQAPVVQDAIRKATVTGANDAARNGFTPTRNPFAMNRQTGRMELRSNPDGSQAIPSLQFWDEVKKNLDKVGSRDAQDFSRVLREHLDTLIPSYREARAGAAHFFGAQNALEAGQNFVTSRMANHDARRALAQMSPTERQLFQDGFVSRFMESLNEAGDRRSVLNKIAESPAARERLQIALGSHRATELEAMMRVEGIMDLARSAVQGNSTTARQLAELGLAGGTYGFSGGGVNPFQNPSALMNAAIVYGAARGRSRINENLSRRVAEMLVSNDPRILLQGIRTVARNQNLFNSFRAADRGLARIGAEQASGVPAIGNMSIGRASDQPNVQRPSGQ